MPQAAAAAAIAASTAALSTAAAGTATAIATAGGLAAAGGLAGAVASVSLSSVIASAAVAGVLGGAQALMAQRNAPRPKASVAFRQAIPDGQIVYGECRVSGPMALFHRGESSSAERRNLHVVMVLACHEIEDVLEIWNGDERIWSKSGGVDSDYSESVGFVVTRLGTATQAASSELIGELPTTLGGGTGTNFRLRGCAYIALRLDNIPRRWRGGLPQLWCRVRGAKVYDPRTGTTVYSANAALCLADFLTRTRGGCGWDYSQIDEAALIAAANICDESVALKAGGTQPRYRIHGTIPALGSIEQVEAMLPYLMGSLVDREGRLAILAGAYSAPVATITKADLLAPPSIGGAVKVEQRLDGVTGVWANPAAKFQPDDFGRVLFSDYDPADGAERMLDVRLERETSAERAQRLAVLTARTARRALKVEALVSTARAEIEAGDRVQLTFPEVGIDGAFEVIRSTLRLSPAGSAVVLELLEDGPSFWAWDPNAATTPPTPLASNLPNPFRVEPPVAPVTVTPIREVQQDGTTRTGLRVQWGASPDRLLDRYRVYWTQSGRRQSVDVEDTDVDLLGLARGVAATIQVAAVNSLNRLSPLISASSTPTGDVTAPAAPPSATVAGETGGRFRFVVNLPADRDLAAIRVFRGNIGDVSAPATPLRTISATPGEPSIEFVLGGYGNLAGRRWWFSAVDRTGNASTLLGPIDATTPDDTLVDGQDGLSVAQLMIYRRAASAPAAPTGGSFNFGTGVLTPPSGWSAGVPSGTDPVYVAIGIASVSTPGGTDSSIPWGSVALAFRNGVDGNGINGRSTLQAPIFRRSTTTPATPSGGTFNFGTEVLTPPSGWSAAVPSGTNPIWVCYATFSVSGDTGTANAGPWSAPALLAESGANGADAISTFTFNIYRRAASAPATPTGGSYNFGTEVITPPSGWSAGVPSGSNPLWVSRTIASITGTTGTDSSLTWTAPTIMAQDGAPGPTGPGGADGARGPGRWHIPVSTLPATGASFEAIQAIWNAWSTIGPAVEGDQAWFYTGPLSSPTGQRVFIRRFGSGWVLQTEVVDGNLLVTGTITANKIIAKEIDFDRLKDDAAFATFQIDVNGAGGGLNQESWTNAASVTLPYAVRGFCEWEVDYARVTGDEYGMSRITVNGVELFAVDSGVGGTQISGVINFTGLGTRIRAVSHRIQSFAAGAIVRLQLREPPGTEIGYDLARLIVRGQRV